MIDDPQGEGREREREMSGVVEKALRCLGRGFDVNSDFRTKYCKGNERLVLLSEETTELAVPGFGAVEGVSVDVKCGKGDRIRYQSDVLEFNQMSLLLNQRSSLPGKIPSGLFNSMFGFAGGSWAQHASNTRCLAFDGYFISLFNLRIDGFPLTPSDEVIGAVPSTWDPAALARFIENYGTHVVVGLSVGGQDVVFVRQDQSSKLSPSELKEHLHNLGDQLFTGACSIPLSKVKTRDNRQKVPEAFNVFDPQPVLADEFPRISSKGGITVICSKRGGDASANSHYEWLHAVPSSPDVINFTFMPITSLLRDVMGKGFLTHAINLYLRYKPPISDLEQFFGFQSHKIWAPVLNDLPLGPCSNRSSTTASLQLSLMGAKLFVNTTEVVVGTAPVTGMRLHLEGKRHDRLAVHLQHLSIMPHFLSKLQSSTATRLWKDSTADEVDEGFYEPIQKKKFSHVCTALIEYDRVDWSPSNSAFIVTGAQLHVEKRGSRSILRLRLLYTEVPGYRMDRSVWEQRSSTSSSRILQRGSGSGGLLSTLSTTFSGNSVSSQAQQQQQPVVMDSAVFPSGPPEPACGQKMLKVVDTSQVCRGPQDSPGHWLVTGAGLVLEKGRVGLQVKFSLLCAS